MARDDDRIIPLYDFGVEDLRQWHIVEATCFNCRRTEVVRHAFLQAADEPSVRLVRIKAADDAHEQLVQKRTSS